MERLPEVYAEERASRRHFAKEEAPRGLYVKWNSAEELAAKGASANLSQVRGIIEGLVDDEAT